MLQTAIISDLHDWHTEKLSFFLKKFGCKVKKLKFSDVRINISSKKKFFNSSLHNVDAVWVRYFDKGSLEEITTKLTFLHLLKELNIYIHNSADVIEKTVDKVRTSGLLKVYGLNGPNTEVWIGGGREFNLKKPTLMKPIFGSQGKGIKLLKKQSEIKNLLPSGNVYYMQSFLGKSSEKNFSDIRVLVSHHKVVASMKRESKQFLTNVYQGAFQKKIELSEDIKEIAEKISKILNLGYGGIDFKIYKKKVYILEVNSIPSWKHLDKLYKKDISEKLVKDFIKITKMFKKCHNN